MKTLYALLNVIGMRTPELREVQPMRYVFSHGRRRAAMASLLILAGTIVISRTVKGQFPPSSSQTFIPNGTSFLNPGGDSQTYSTVGGGIDQAGPFFQSLGTNGRSCASCHQPSDAMSVSALDVQLRFDQTAGQDPIFRTVDGSNCDHNIDVSTLLGRYSAYSLLRTRGLIRIALAVPSGANYAVTAVGNPYACNETNVISQYRRPLPATNLRFLSTVMWDGRESTPLTGTTKILYANYPGSLQGDLAHQSVDATVTHAQGDGTRPTTAEQQEIVNFEMALYTAQSLGFFTGPLNSSGGNGGPAPLATLPFFISINSSVHALLPNGPEQPGGLVTPGDGQFTSNIFNLYNAWSALPSYDLRASVARGQTIFNTRPITITGVAGINDDVSEGGLVSGGIPSLTGTCGTCHDSPNVGNHSFPTPLNIGTGDPSPSNASVNMGGLDITYLPRITVCQLVNGQPGNNCKTTSDLGQALIDGNFAHVGKIKGPILRGLSARAPYFHNGSAQTLLDVVHFYENRFALVLSPQDELDLFNFLSVL
jgi:cytochrome c peroxidase